MKLHLINVLFLLLNVYASAQQRVVNPVIRGDFADPTVIRIDDRYYAAGTSSEWAPHYPLFESTDLVNWQYVGPAFAERPVWTRGSFWAPELCVLNDRIYLYYTARRASDGVSYIGVATTDDIRRGFEDHGCLVAYGTEAIDAFVLEDAGRLYISWKAYGLDRRPIELLCSELSADGLRLVGEPFTLLKDDERMGMEGQCMFKRGEWYYLLYSIRGCCGAGSDYAVAVARSKALKGPYEKYEGNPILQGDGEGVLSCGHGTITETPEGRMFYLFHAYRTGSGFYNGRQAFVKEMAVGDDGWPHFTTGSRASLEEPAPVDGIKQTAVSNFVDMFDGDRIRPEWTWDFTSSDLQTTVKDGTLFLNGSCVPDNRYGGTALCLRALLPDYEIATQVKDVAAGISSGLTLYGDRDNLIFWGRENGDMTLKRIEKGVETVLFHKQATGGDLHLSIAVADGCLASFYWSADGKNRHKLPIENQRMDVSFLPPWDRAFRPGLIHMGDETIPAQFAYAKLNYTTE